MLQCWAGDFHFNLTTQFIFHFKCNQFSLAHLCATHITPTPFQCHGYYFMVSYFLFHLPIHVYFPVLLCFGLCSKLFPVQDFSSLDFGFLKLLLTFVYQLITLPAFEFSILNHTVTKCLSVISHTSAPPLSDTLF